MRDPRGEPVDLDPRWPSRCRVAWRSCPPRALARSGQGDFHHRGSSADVTHGLGPQNGIVIRGVGRDLGATDPEPLPRQTRTLASTRRPLVPGPFRSLDDEELATEVAGHREVVEVTLNALAERGMLSLHRMVAVAPAPFVNGCNRPSELARLVGHLVSDQPLRDRPQ